MRNRFVLLFLGCCFLLAQAEVSGQSSNLTMRSEPLRVQGGQYNLFGYATGSLNTSSEPNLIVVLHGDAPPPYENPEYHYIFAARAVEVDKTVIAVGLLRPGYTDPQGNHSEGERGQLNGDNWNAQNTDAIAQAIRKLKDRYHARNVIVAGHSGGAAITANILGRHPELIDAALLVSCPCGHVDERRKNMLDLTGIPVFKGSIDTLSPINQVDDISDKSDITLVVGTQDKVTPPKFSKKFVSALLGKGRAVKYIELEGKSHNVFLDPKVLAELGALVERLNNKDN